MDTVVLIKQVLEIDKIKFDTEKGTLDRSSAGVETNPFDLNAPEAAITITTTMANTSFTPLPSVSIHESTCDALINLT